MIIVTKPTKTGRLTLHNNALTEFDGEKKTQTSLSNKEELLRVLRDIFGVELLNDLRLQLPFKFIHEQISSDFFKPLSNQFTSKMAHVVSGINHNVQNGTSSKTFIS